MIFLLPFILLLMLSIFAVDMCQSRHASMPVLKVIIVFAIFCNRLTLLFIVWRQQSFILPHTPPSLAVPIFLLNPPSKICHGTQFVYGKCIVQLVPVFTVKDIFAVHHQQLMAILDTFALVDVRFMGIYLAPYVFKGIVHEFNNVEMIERMHRLRCVLHYRGNKGGREVCDYMLYPDIAELYLFFSVLVGVR